VASSAGTVVGSTVQSAVGAATHRLDEIEAAVADWSSASTIGAAHAAAERARNLVTGAGTLGAGDLDGDGVSGGLEDPGLLPGEDGTPGLASPLTTCPDVERDVLGGSWDSPVERWALVQAAIDEWTPANNTFPSLPSHPQRIVGWSSLTLASSSLDDAHEYAGHAQLHVDVARRALDSCSTPG
jgi:hypothetical protein